MGFVMWVFEVPGREDPSSAQFTCDDRVRLRAALSLAAMLTAELLRVTVSAVIVLSGGVVVQEPQYLLLEFFRLVARAGSLKDRVAGIRVLRINLYE